MFKQKLFVLRSCNFNHHLVVDPQKRSHKTSHSHLFALVALGLITPSAVHAGVLASLTDKVKAMFVQEEDDQSAQLLATSQTMAVFKPNVVEDSATNTDDMANDNQDSLQAVSGSLRLSTEDVDFPTTDTISVYEVKKGDTIQDVAKLFSVSVNTIVWANNLSSKTITPGETLVILPITGIKHSVKKGDTVTSIAKKYKADALDIANYNGITPDAVLVLGDTILVPDGEIEVAQPVKKIVSKTKSKILDSYNTSAGSGFFVRPVLGGRKTQGIHGHNAVDIAATPGTPVIAAASGRAIVVKLGGYNGGYGNLIIITHEKGIQTVYAHLRDIYITQGQSVTQGQTIGEVGNTGRSTGPHLHFEIRGAKNPF